MRALTLPRGSPPTADPRGVHQMTVRALVTGAVGGAGGAPRRSAVAVDRCDRRGAGRPGARAPLGTGRRAGTGRDSRRRRTSAADRRRTARRRPAGAPDRHQAGACGGTAAGTGRADAGGSSGRYRHPARRRPRSAAPAGRPGRRAGRAPPASGRRRRTSTSAPRFSATRSGSTSSSDDTTVLGHRDGLHELRVRPRGSLRRTPRCNDATTTVTPVDASTDTRPTSATRRDNAPRSREPDRVHDGAACSHAQSKIGPSSRVRLSS